MYMYIVKDRPLLSSEKAPPINKPATVRQKKILVVSPKWVLDTRQTGRLTVGRNITLTLT
jgi:hypothetical protein